ncbi:MAG: hypothetical protein KA251_00300 [Saprospiraceae bacterium]|nr:hypothetical protein [Candidatus Vicinibacter affinis]MBP6172675.1 hypothetical protein [Saprospiraceae bacterium]MBK6574245.1 hypothetical protein [Candidatus Vicinibacter affinis]MBK7302498.1 hypothetical protein [Candidatus Vicinibacter affinis]MBK7695829.1 hypothetical protein [Candidatus Vicinibacter affinis]
MRYSLCGVLTCLTLFSLNLHAQTARKTSIIRISEQIGCVIDSIEFRACDCMKYVSADQILYALIIKKPDLQIFLKIKSKTKGEFDDVFLTDSLLESIHRQLTAMKYPPNTVDESKLLKSISKDTLYNFIDYADLNSKVQEDNSITESVEQKEDKKDSSSRLFYKFGLGPAYFRSNVLFSFGIGISYIYHHNVFSIRNFYVKEFDFPFKTKDPLEGAMDLALLYGRGIPSNNVLVTFSTGLAFTGSTTRGNFISRSGGFFGTSSYERKIQNSIGIPLELEILFGTNRHISANFLFFSNINKYNSFGGFMIAIRFGKLDFQ